MTFFMLTPNDFFGGGVLLLKDHRGEASSPRGRSHKTEDFGTLSVVRITNLIYLDRGLGGG